VPQSRRPYSRKHLKLEKGLGWLYSGSWPAKLWDLVQGSTRVTLLRHDVTVPGRGTDRPSLRIAFASDLHLGPTTPPALLDHAFALLREAEPDVLALGGDYVFLGATKERVEELKARVAGVEARTKVAVLGNHDFWARPDRIVDALTRAGAHVLVDQGLALPPPHDDIGIIGLDDPLTSGQVRDARAAAEGVGRALSSLPSGLSNTLAVAHSPDSLPGLRGRGVSVLLCGHTHGGQVALPGYRPLVMPSRVGRRYPFGVHRIEEDGLSLFVSRGLGTSLIPLRTWAPEDLAVFTVR
jgi:predicted MPP superfamily phosphohydrolase